MKTTFLIFLFTSFLFFFGNSQVNSNSLFAQGLLTVENKTDLLEKEAELRNHPHIELCRLDFESKRFFILTKGIDALTEDQLIHWFASVELPINCIQIGKYGIDAINRYPFVNCPD